MKKRILALALTLCLSLGLAAPALAAEEPRFADVPAGSWYEAAVELCADRGIMVGTGEGTFSPEATLTGAECMVLALRLHSLLHGGTGSFEKAPEDWGKLTLTLADGTRLTSCGRTSAPIPGREEGTFAFGWRTWGMMGHVSADHLQIDLFPDAALEWDTPEREVAQEALYEWGKAHEGAATVTVGDTVISGTVNCWIPTGNWVLAFYPDDDEDGVKRETMREAVYSDAPALDAWYRDAVWYARQHELEGFSTSEEPASRVDFAANLAAATGELSQIRQVDLIPGVEDIWYSQNAYMLYRAGVLTGKDEYGSFDPEGTLTRAEAATMVARVLDESLRLDGSLAPLPTEGYTLTYLMDGEADCGVTYPVCPLASGTETREVGGILLLDGTLLPWPGSVYSSGLEQMGEYAWFVIQDETTENPWDSNQGLMAANGSWAVSPGNYEQEELAAYAYAAERTVQRPYDCRAGVYWDAGGHPVSQKFDWCGDLSAEGQGFAGLEGKIYRIQFEL